MTTEKIYTLKTPNAKDLLDNNTLEGRDRYLQYFDREIQKLILISRNDGIILYSYGNLDANFAVVDNAISELRVQLSTLGYLTCLCTIEETKRFYLLVEWDVSNPYQKGKACVEILEQYPHVLDDVLKNYLLFRIGTLLNVCRCISVKNLSRKTTDFLSKGLPEMNLQMNIYCYCEEDSFVIKCK